MKTTTKLLETFLLVIEPLNDSILRHVFEPGLQMTCSEEMENLYIQIQIHMQIKPWEVSGHVRSTHIHVITRRKLEITGV